MDIKNTMDYYEQLYAHKLDNPDKTGQFFEGYSLPTFTQEEIDNLNGPIFTKESEPIISNLPKIPWWILPNI